MPPARPDGRLREGVVEPSAVHLVGAFARASQRHPHATALSDGERSWTFEELAVDSHRLAVRIREALAEVVAEKRTLREPRVALVAEARAESVVAILAILEAGAAYVPLEPSHPVARLGFQLRDAGVALVLGGERALDRLASEIQDLGLATLGLDEVSQAPGPDRVDEAFEIEEDATSPNGTGGQAGPVDPEQLAYVIYTSGSTGQPKGVGVCHRTVLHLIESTRDSAPCGPGQASTLFHSLAFDLSVWELWRPLLGGGRLVVVPEVLRGRGEGLLELLDRQQVSQLSLTPSALRVLLAAGFGPARPSQLSHLFVGGEAIEVERLRPWLDGPTNGLKIDALYGPTEATVWSTRHSLGRGDLVARSGGATPLGSPIPGWTLDLDPCTGEIHLGGIALARGYFGRPALTADRFVPDPVGSGARRYRTGDRGRRRGDGTVEFLGRTDHQVKIRGFRIELGEIEAVLARHSDLHEAAVVVSRDRLGEPTLVAHGVLAAPSSGNGRPAEDGERFRKHLAELLPKVQVPARVVLWSELPRLSSGKVDRQTLARHSQGWRPGEAAEAASGEPRQREMLAALWGEFLGRDPQALDGDASFFALGGHSLLLTQLLAAIRGRLGLAVDLERLLANPTLEGLCQAVRRPSTKLGATGSTDQGSGVRPARSAQRSLWWAHQGGVGRRGSGALHEIGTWRLSGPLAPESWTTAWDRLVVLQPALRASFQHHGEQVHEVVAETSRGRWPHLGRLDLTGLARSRAHSELDRWRRSLALAPFEVEEGPLVRAVLATLAPEEHRLVLVAHHLATDGWSDVLLPRQLTRLVAGQELFEGVPPGIDSPLAGSPPEVPPDWMVAEVTDLPDSRLIPDRAPGSSIAGWAGRRRGQLAPAVAAALASRARALETTESVVLLALTLAFGGRLMATDTLAIGWPTSGRTADDTERLGCFADLQVVRSDLCAPQPVAGGRWRALDPLVRSTRGRTLRLLGLQGVGFEHWMRAARLAEGEVETHDGVHHPLVQIVLAPQDFPVADPEVPGLTIDSDSPQPTGTRFDLEILSRHREDGSLELDWIFPLELFDPVTVERWRRGFERFVAGALESTDRPLDTVEWWSAAEWHQVVSEWNDTAAPEVWGPGGEKEEPGLFERVRRRAETLGDATAVVAERADGAIETLSWIELVARAQSLAQRLVARGLDPEEPVALLFERGLASVVAMLGVLAAGGATLPLDPSWPTAHRQRLVRRAGARWALRVGDRGDDEIETAVDTQSGGAPEVVDLDATVSSGWVLSPGDRLAYLMATSGSTGEPKLVAIPQRAVVRLVLGARWIDLDDQVVFHYAPETFDASTFEIWGALLAGRRLVIAPPGPLSLAEIARQVERHRVTTLWQTTPLFHQAAQGPLGRLRGLDYWFTGGDVVRPAAVARVQRLLPGTELHIAYGPTENTTFSTTAALAPGAARSGRLPVGRPLTHDRLWVLDPRLEPLALGVPGEVGVSGPGLARGYRGNPRATAERFVPHPRPRIAGERLYRTGDRGRWSTGGQIDFLGRFDRQLKIRGIRVEPMATEHALAEFPGVDSVAVVVVRDGEGAASLGAVLVTRGTVAEGWLADVRRRAHELLPEAQLPTRWRVVDRLPTTASGKIDRQHLARSFAETTVEEVRGRAPEGPWEVDLAKLWSTSLGLDLDAEIDVEQTFFELGGDSLRITRLAAEIQRRWGFELPLRHLFENPTLAELALRLEGMAREPSTPQPRARAKTAAGVPIARDGEVSEGPVTWAQRRLWTVAQATPDDPTDVVPIGWRLEGRLDDRALRTALADLVERHEGLRSHLVERDGEPRLRIEQIGAVSCLRVDLTALPTDRGRRISDRLARRGARRVFEIAKSPLWRLTVVTLGPEEHQLLFEAHHVLVDGAALVLFCRDLGLAYAARRRGATPWRGALELGLTEATREQRRRWARQQGRLEKYWRSRLAGLAPSELPTDRSSVGSGGARPASRQVAWGLSRTTGSRLRALAAKQGATLWVALLACHALLLERLGANSGSALATPESGRDGAREVLACFAELLVFRSPLRGPRATLVQYLEATRKAAERDLEHRGIPFDHLLSPQLGVATPPDRRRHPLAQVSVAVHSGEVAELELEGLRVERRPIVGESTHLDLEIHLWPHADGRIEGYGTFRPDLFDRTTIERWSRLFSTLTGQLVERAERPIEVSDGLAPAVRHQLLVEWNDQRRDLGAAGTLHALIRQRLLAQGERTVLLGVDGDGWSAAELLDRSAALARVLRRLGVGAESVVAVEVPRGPRQMVAFLAVLAAGGAYLPVDPEHPVDHRRRVLETAGVEVRVGTVDAEPESPAPAEIWVGIDAEGRCNTAPSFVRGPGARPWPEPSPPSPLSRGGRGSSKKLAAESAAYVLFTSGSSGRPKGVVVSHRAIVHHMLWIERALPLGPADRLLQKTPAVFDASVWEHWLPLMTGARLVMAPPGLERDPEALVAILESEEITVLQVVPTQLRLLLTVPGFARGRHLRRVVSGGEALTRELVAAFRRQGPPAQLVNVYGPTEATIHATWEPRPDPGQRPSASLGRPLDNTALWVVDRSLRPASPGVVGRLVVTGPGLARGYLGNPRATAEAFLPAPWLGPDGLPGGRLYDTGDLGRWLSDGRLEWIGRADRQIKWRGVRLEPAEIEAALVAEPEVRQAVVDTIRDDSRPGAPIRDDSRLGASRPGNSGPGAQGVDDPNPGSEGPGHLVAWLVPAGTVRPAGHELARRLRGSLPGGVVPNRWQWLDELPRTAGGKVDRRRLARSAVDRSEPTGSGLGASEGGLVGEVARLWVEVLGIEGPVDPDVAFFDQGGHSLLATQLLGRVRRAFGVDVPLAELFAHPTLADLEGAIRRGRRKASAQAPLLELEPSAVDDTGPWPATLAQRRLWFLHRLEPASTAYTMPAGWRIRGPLDRRALEQALGRVLERHPALRTRFPDHRGAPRQEVARRPVIVLPRIDLRYRSQALEDLLRRWTHQVFDLTCGPPWRAVLARVRHDEHLLLIDVHHIVFDGWSASRVAGELGTLYAASIEGREQALEPSGPDPGAIARAQETWLDHPALEAQRRYWRGRLEHLPTLELPTDRPRSRSRRRRAGGLDLDWGGLATPITSLARDHGVTPFMVLLASQAALLQRSGAGSDLALGSPVAGRRQPELDRVVGFFVNLLVFRLRPGAGQRFDQLLAATREVALGAFDHQELPFERLVEDLAPERRDERNPLVSVSLALQNVPKQSLHLADCKVEPLDIEPPETRFDLEAYFWSSAQGLRGRLVYRRDLFDPTTMQRLAARWRRILETVTRNPTRRLDDLPALGRGERHQLLVEWGGSADRPSDHPEGRFPTVVERFFAQARRRPDAVAVREGRTSRSYRQLAQQATDLAWALTERGLGREDRIALLIEPSAELLAAMIAVMAVGATQLPLDPSHPAERLAYVLDDAGVALLVGPPESVPAGYEGATLELGSVGRTKAPVSWRPKQCDPKQLAYVIYTSGSTGRPKGVGVSHRALARLLTAVGPPFDPGPDDVWSLFHSAAFDFSVWETWGALVLGGAVAVIRAEERQDPHRVLEALDGYRVTILDLTPSALRWLRDAGGVERWPCRLRWILFGGEALDPSLLEPFFEGGRGGERQRPRWANLYGITETTVHATWHELGWTDVVDARRRRGSPIGRPLADLVARVFSPTGEPVALGVAGELWIGGPGVARGYLGRPALTADRFRPDPWATGPGGRLYRSGDRARWDGVGRLEYLGRYDDQVQLRGHRVEPGEVAAQLLEDPEVVSAAVVVLGGPDGRSRDGGSSEDRTGELRLAAAVVPEAGRVAATPVDGEERNTRWQQVYDTLYREDQPAEVGFDIRGWTSGISGEPIPCEDMRRWRDRLLRRILRSKPRTGSPWRVWEIGCGSGMLLHGLAPEADRYLATDLSATTLERLAGEVASRQLRGVELEHRSADDFEGREEPAFDLVILSSVIQYFHGGDQLAGVLQGAMRALVPGGKLFLGDVRNLASFGVFRRQVERIRGHGHPALASGSEAQGLRHEQELLVHPALFAALPEVWPEVAEVDILPRLGEGELERHRYDVVLHRSGKEMGDVTPRFVEPWVNDPLADDRHRVWCEALRRRLTARLPRYLVPTVVDTVSELPRTANGKVDRQALVRLFDRPAVPGSRVAGAGPTVDSDSPQTSPMLELWGDVLGRRVGLDDDFFDLGGHSLLATRLVARIRSELGREVPLAWLFEDRTVRGLNARLEQAPRARESPIRPRPAIDPREVEEVPLAPPQERLWFVEQLEPGGGAYAMPAAWRIRGPLRIGVLARALDDIVRRHHSLRSAVVAGPEGPLLRIPPRSAPVPRLLVVDLRGVGRRSSGEVIAEGHRVLEHLTHQPFDLEQGGLLRAVLLRLDENQALLGLVTHHLVFDGVSETLVLRELAERYAAAAGRRSPRVAEARLDYADFALWQRTGASEERRRQGMTFWRERLAEAPQLDLPTDHPRPSPRRSQGRSLWVPLSPDTLPGVDALARQTGQSRFGIVLAVFFGFLVRWTGQRDLVVGTPVANRGHRELEGIVGCFVNTVAIRPGLLDSALRFDQLVAKVGGSLAESLEHQEVPFADLVADLDPQRDPTRLPLVEVALGLATAAEGGLDLTGCITEPLGIDFRRTPFDLMVTLRERVEASASGVSWGIEWRHASDLFDPTTARRQAEGFARILTAAVSAVDRSLGSLSPLAAAERHQLVVEWPDSDPMDEAEPPGSRSWLGQLLTVLDARGGRAALRWRGRDVSAARLVSRVRRLAALLGSRLEGPEPRVAVLLDRSPEWVEVMLAIVALGGVAVPLDPTHPRQRQEAQLVEVSPALVVGGIEAQCLAMAIDVPWFDPGTTESDSPSPERFVFVEPHPEALAQLLFTSGSTGRPKAVAVTHRGLASYFATARRRYPWRGRGVPFFTSVAVDLTVTGWLLPLVAGEPVEILEGAATDTEILEALLRPEGWSLIKLTPSHLELLDLVTEGGDEASPATADSTGVDALVVGGEPLTPRILARAQRHFPRATIFNEYGPTETTVGSTVEALSPGDPGAGEGGVAIGRPWGDERVVILDRQRRTLPRGAVGELLIGGPGLARGYWGWPARTAEAFLPDPNAAHGPGSRLYATGDLARWNTKGRLELRGRRDAQLAVRGHRVEPGEVEAAFEALEGVARAVVLPWGEGLVGALVGAGSRPDDRTIRQHLGRRLPPAWIPGSWYWLESLPIAPSGKVDTRALSDLLRQAEREHRSITRSSVGRDALVEEIRAIWASVLSTTDAEDTGAEATRSESGPVDLPGDHPVDLPGDRPVDLPVDLPVDRDFFALGGHSLAALRLIQRLRSSLSLEVPLHRLLAGATIVDLAAEWVATTPAERPEVGDRRRGGWEPLTAAQERCFHRAIPVDHPGLHLVWVRRLRGPLDHAGLLAAVHRVVGRHESFRTVFDLSQRHQRVLEEVTLPWSQVDLRRLAIAPEAEIEHLRPWLLRWADARFDLEGRPPVRWLLAELGKDDHLLALTMHHLVVDGASLVLLEEELATAYRSIRSGGSSSCEPLPGESTTLQPIDLARSEVARTHGVGTTRPGGTGESESTSAHEIVDRLWPEAPPGPVGGGLEKGTDVRSIELGVEVGQRLVNRAQEQGTTLLTLLMAALARVLTRILDRDTVDFGTVDLGTVVANRQRHGLERTLGFLTEVAVLRVDLRGVDDSLEAHLGVVRRVLVEALARLEGGAERRREVARARRCRVVLNLQRSPAVAAESLWGDLRVDEVDLERPIHAIRDLGVYARTGADGLELVLVSDRRRVASTLAERLRVELRNQLEVWGGE